jgi:hypothetical protein
LRQDIAFVSVGSHLRKPRARKLLNVDRASYRYEPRPDRNPELHEELVKPARQKPRCDHRRLQAVLEHRGHAANVKPIQHLYAEQGWRCNGSKQLVQKQPG